MRPQLLTSRSTARTVAFLLCCVSALAAIIFVISEVPLPLLQVQSLGATKSPGPALPSVGSASHCLDELRLTVANGTFQGRSWKEQVWNLQAFLQNGGILFHQHTRKTGGTAVRKLLRDFELCPPIKNHGHTVLYSSLPPSDVRRSVHCTEMEWGAVNPHLCFENNALIEEASQQGQGVLAITTIRDPLSRHISDFFYAGPGNVLYSDGSKSSRPAPSWASTDVETWRRWIQEGLDMPVSMPFNRTQYRGVYRPNLMTLMLTGHCPSTTSLELVYPDEGDLRKGSAHRPYLCPACPFTFVHPVKQRTELQRRLQLAKRTLLSFDLVIPQPNISSHNVLFDIVQRYKHPERTPSAFPLALNANPNEGACPSEIADEILSLNWADQELYDFGVRLFNCKQQYLSEHYDALFLHSNH